MFLTLAGIPIIAAGVAVITASLKHAWDSYPNTDTIVEIYSGIVGGTLFTMFGVALILINELVFGG
jgi:hypothetical protein